MCEKNIHVPKQIADLFDGEFRIDLHYRGEKVGELLPPSILFRMFTEVVEKALKEGVPKEINIKFKEREVTEKDVHVGDQSEGS